MSRLSSSLLICCCTAALAACDLGTYQAQNPDGGLLADADIGQPPPNRDPQLGCAGACHGDETSIAPPKDLQGETSPTVTGVGAHRNHLDPATTWHRVVQCSDCHQVPSAVGDPGHTDTPAPAELTFSALASQGGAATWDGATCSNVYCHGATLPGGTLTEPSWTTTDGSQDACGTCHGFPPPDPHPANTDCGACHPTVQPGATNFLDPDSHINGTLELNQDNQACDSCHGGGGISAPPTDLDGNTDRTAPGVGAHREHIGASDWHRELNCAQCHKVPTGVDDPDHIDGDDQAELTFDPLNPDAVYDPATNTCQNLYCHGNGWNALGSMTWTEDVTLGCGSCHRVDGDNMSGKHDKHLEEDTDCADCHSQVVDGARTIIGPSYHVNGLHEVDMVGGGTYDPTTRECSNIACHNNKRW